MISTMNTKSIELRLDVEYIGTELGNNIINEFNTLANPNFPLVECGLEIAQEPKAYEYYLNCVNVPQKKIDVVMENIAKMLKEVA